MTLLGLCIAIIAGTLIGFSMGAVGGGGAILAVPVLVYGLHQSPLQATTGSLIVVGTTAVLGAVIAGRQRRLDLGQGLAFGALGIVGSAVGAVVAHRVSPQVLMACFAALMLVVVFFTIRKIIRTPRDADPPEPNRNPALLITLATTVGLMTGFLGVGGGFMIVPALTLVLGVEMRRAAGTSLVVIAISCFAALAARLSTAPGQVQPHWPSIGVLTVLASLGLLLGASVARRAHNRTLSIGFAGLVASVALYTAARAFPAVIP